MLVAVFPRPAAADEVAVERGTIRNGVDGLALKLGQAGEILVRAAIFAAGQADCDELLRGFVQRRAIEHGERFAQPIGRGGILRAADVIAAAVDVVEVCEPQVIVAEPQKLKRVGVPVAREQRLR